MVFIWGFKRTERSLGYAADFCTMCRDVRCVRVYRIGVAAHFYYLSGKGALRGHVARCESCGQGTDVSLDRYAALQKRPSSELAAIEAETFPDLRLQYGERLALEQRLRAGRAELTVDQREQLIREPILTVLESLAERCARWHVDRRAVASMLATVFVPALLLMSLHEGMDYELRDELQLVALAVFGLGALVSLALLLSDVPRFVRRRILPKLADTLRILQPSADELEQCVAALRQVGLTAAKKLRSDRLHHLIEVPPAGRDDEARGGLPPIR